MLVVSDINSTKRGREVDWQMLGLIFKWVTYFSRRFIEYANEDIHSLILFITFLWDLYSKFQFMTLGDHYFHSMFDMKPLEIHN